MGPPKQKTFLSKDKEVFCFDGGGEGANPVASAERESGFTTRSRASANFINESDQDGSVH